MSEILRDVFGNAVELTDERWQHILLHHPVMGRYRTRIAEVLSDPNVVQQ
jgi:hypothetical protein